MFKKITLTLLFSLFCTHQSLAGSGLSTPSEQEPENQKKKPNTHHNSDKGREEITRGLAALTISGGANQKQPFHYQNETFSTEAWKKEHGLKNNFTSSPDEDPDVIDAVLHTYNGCAAIDLRPFDETHSLEGAHRIDLHPVFNKNPRKHLRNEIFEKQRAYENSETKENKIYIITGTGKKRAGPNFTLQNAVNEWLQEDYCERRILKYELEHEGFFAVFLRKQKK